MSQTPAPGAPAAASQRSPQGVCSTSPEDKEAWLVATGYYDRDKRQTVLGFVRDLRKHDRDVEARVAHMEEEKARILREGEETRKDLKRQVALEVLEVSMGEPLSHPSQSKRRRLGRPRERRQLAGAPQAVMANTGGSVYNLGISGDEEEGVAEEEEGDGELFVQSRASSRFEDSDSDYEPRPSRMSNLPSRSRRSPPLEPMSGLQTPLALGTQSPGLDIATLNPHSM